MSESSKASLAIIVYLALALVTAAVFCHVRNFDFINYDDMEYVSETPHVLNGLTSDGIIWAFTTSRAANWHPLTWLSLMFDCQLSGSNPGWIHSVNLLLHLANTLLLFAVLKKITGLLWPSAFVAAAFALHPMHVESVAWIAERKDVLSTLFWLLTLAAYIGYIKRPTAFRYLGTLAIFVLGLLAKPMLVTLPFVLLLLDYWPLGRFTPPKTIKVSGRQSRRSTPVPDKRAILYRLIIEKVPFFVLSAASCVITFLVQRSAMVDVNALPLQSRLANAFLSYARYIGKLFWPENLAVFYPFDTDSFVFWQVALCILLLLVISVFVIRVRNHQRYLFVGWFWFLGTLVPVIGLVQVGAQSLADRYTYIPYIGLFIMIAWGVPQLLSQWQYRKIAIGISTAIALTALATAAYRQTSYWQNSATLFTHALDVTQNNYIAHGCLADDLRKHGNTALAIEHYKKVLAIKPNRAIAILNLGCAFHDQGDIVQAIECFQKALLLRPNSANAHNDLAVALSQQGRLLEAVAEFSQALRIAPDFAQAHYNFAVTLMQLSRLDDAVVQFRQVVLLKPDWPDPMNNFASLLATHPELKNRNVNEAVSLAGRACELTNYKNPVFLDTLAAAYASAGRFPEAVAADKTALSLAAAANQLQLKNDIERHLASYSQGKLCI